MPALHLPSPSSLLPRPSTASWAAILIYSFP